MVFIIKQFWLLCLATTIFNGYLLRMRTEKYAIANPDLKQGYEDYTKGYMIFLGIPWIIMGIGNLSGLTESPFDFFTPRRMNPIVLVFHASLVILWLLSIRWIYFKNGAEFLEKHPGLVRIGTLGEPFTVTAKQVKIFYPIMLLFGILAMIGMWRIDAPIVL